MLLLISCIHLVHTKTLFLVFRSQLFLLYLQKTSRALLDIQLDVYKCVEKLELSLFSISSCPEILNFIWLSWYLLLKIACLHVSFTAYENFYKLSRNALSSRLVFHFPTIRSIRKQRSINQTYIHLYTDHIIHNYICDRSLSGDPFHIVNPFLNTKGLYKCDSTHIPN